MMMRVKVAVAIVLTVTLGGCGLSDQAQTLLTTDEAQAPEVAPSPPGEPTSVVACLDGSGSFGDGLWRQTVEQVATAVEEYPERGRGELTLWVRTLDGRSADRGSTAVTVPAVPDEPEEPDYAAWPFEAGDLRETYQSAVRKVAGRLNVATDAAAEIAATIRATPYPDADTTDVYGCIEVAAQLLADRPGRRVLLVSSDLDHTAAVQPAQMSLDGTEVLVAPFRCEDTGQCGPLRSEWQARFEEMGAGSVQFRRPESPDGSRWVTTDGRDR